MSRLLLPLETLSQKHSDVVIQELASNLRTVIATHGAYQPENLTAAAQPSRNPETVKNNSGLSRKKQKLQTEANNSQTNPYLSSLGGNSLGGSASEITQQDEGRTSGTRVHGSPTKHFSELLLEACDPDVPTRAFALRVLTQRVKNRDPEAVQAQEKVFMVSWLLVTC